MMLDTFDCALVAMPLAVMPLATMPLVVTPMVNTCWWTVVTFNTFASGPLIPLYFNTFSYNTFSYNTFSYNTNGRYTALMVGLRLYKLALGSHTIETT